MVKNGEGVKGMANFTLKTTTSTSLNFLIYIQNLYLSQRENGKNRFPSYRVPFSVFHEDFEANFHLLWETILEKMKENPDSDTQIFHEEKALFSTKLFNEQAVSAVKFEDIYRTFQNWWGSFAGSFAIQRAADDKVNQLYVELTTTQQASVNQFVVSILYDDCVFTEHKTTPTWAITSIPEIYIRYQDVVDRIFA